MIVKFNILKLVPAKTSLKSVKCFQLSRPRGTSVFLAGNVSPVKSKCRIVGAVQLESVTVSA